MRLMPSQFYFTCSQIVDGIFVNKLSFVIQTVKPLFWLIEPVLSEVFISNW